MPTKNQPSTLEGVDCVNPSDGSLWLDGGNVYTDGNGNLSMSSLNPSMSVAAPAVIATAGTIVVPALTSVVRLAPGAAVTGVIMPLGTRNGQRLMIVNTSIAASSITFAASGTSFVANGVLLIIAGLNKYEFQWDSVSSLWY